MADYYLVTRAKGPAWDHSRRRREQAGWDDHAAFMDALVDDGFVVLGGPVGEGDGDDTLQVVDAESESAVTRTPVVMFPAYFFTTLKITVHQQRWLLSARAPAPSASSS